MKKILIILFSIFLSFNTYAANFTNGREYNTLNKKISNVPPIIDFFSFFCPYCYEFEQKYHIRQLINKNTNKKIRFQTYHVNFLGGEASFLLTQAWIIAKIIGVEEKIVIPFFKAAQEKKFALNKNNIRSLFIKETHISLNKYNALWDSFTVYFLIQKQEKYIKYIAPSHVPIVLIKGKYIIDYYILEKYFTKNFSKKYIDIITFLNQL